MVDAGNWPPYETRDPPVCNEYPNGAAKCVKEWWLSHVNEAFNQEMQADFVSFSISDEFYRAFYFVDVGTAYLETKIKNDRKESTLISELETL